MLKPPLNPELDYVGVENGWMDRLLIFKFDLFLKVFKTLKIVLNYFSSDPLYLKEGHSPLNLAGLTHPAFQELPGFCLH